MYANLPLAETENILSEKSIATPDCFPIQKVWILVPYVWKRDSYLNSYALKLLWWLRLLKNSEVRYTIRIPFQKLHLGARFTDCVSGPR